MQERAIEALRLLRERMQLRLREGPNGASVFVADLEDLRHWAAMAAWGLGERQQPDAHDEPPVMLPRGTAIGGIGGQLVRLRGMLQEFHQGKATYLDVAWEVEHLELLWESAFWQLTIAGRWKLLHSLDRYLLECRAGIWRMLRRDEPMTFTPAMLNWSALREFPSHD